MVWQAPDDVQQAARDLRRMHRMGVEAVRTGLIQQDTLLTLADTLGLQLFQELPFDHLPAARLRDTLGYALRLLEPAIFRGRRHPSARTFGLARRSDTSDPDACAFFERIAERIGQSEGIDFRLYYLTSFAEDDACTSAVDFVLLDALNEAAPRERLARWHAARDSAGVSVGLGSVGVWVTGEVGAGLFVPHSPEAQARYFEDQLGPLLADTSAAAPIAVFVHRWRDLDGTQRLADPFGRRYGLHKVNGTPRPALDVVGGLFSGTQDVFAFEAGRQPAPGLPVLILMGWGLLLVIGISYAASPRFRHMVPRYFGAHGFFRDAVREGRDVLLLTSALLLLTVSLSVGILGAVFFATIQYEPAFVLLVQWLPEQARSAVVALLNEPWQLVLLLGSLYALGLALWTTVLSIVSRRRYPLQPGQALMLVVWPRWPLLVVMLASLVVITFSHKIALIGVLVLVGCWLLLTFIGIVRTLYDYAAVARGTFPLVLFLLLANPLVGLSVFALFTALEYMPQVAFLWHLIVRF